MPATMESIDSPDRARMDSAFFDEDHVSSPIDRIRISVVSEGHVRTASLDSGVDTLDCTSTSLGLSMKRTSSGSQLRRPKTESNLLSSNLSGQTTLLLRKMEILEQKLNSMQAQLKQEQLQRLTLEGKVIKLEEENEKLKGNRAKATSQLQEFQERFFASVDSISLKGSSPSPSPYPSVFELRSRSRAGSICSSCSGLRSRPLSGVSIASSN